MRSVLPGREGEKKHDVAYERWNKRNNLQIES